MRRSSALFAAAALAVPLLLLPGTGHADTTSALLTLQFDNAAKDRVVKLKVDARSPSGVASVQARMSYKGGSYATVDLVRTEGTDENGVWTAEFRPDIDARPGVNWVDVVTTMADGVTITRNSTFDDCYLTSVRNLTVTPDVIDADHSEVTLRGSVEFVKYSGATRQPAPGATVQGPRSKTATGDDGRFELTYSGSTEASVSVYAPEYLCGAFSSVPLTVKKLPVELRADFAPGMVVAAGAQMAVVGKALREGTDVPVGGIWVSAGSMDGSAVPTGWVKTAADGTFRMPFTAGRTAGTYGPVYVTPQENAFFAGAGALVGAYDIQNVSKLSGFNPGPEPFPYGDRMKAAGRLTIEPAPAATTKLPVYLEYSADGKWYRIMGKQTLTQPGDFSFSSDNPITQDGYWRVRYQGDALNAGLISWADYIDVKYRTYMASFNASPEPVSKGKTITVKGRLYRYRPASSVAPGAKISVYFKASGTSTWKWMADTKTGSDGWFKKTFTASKDGTWMAKYAGSGTYIASNAPTDYVDVR
ncbi:hypothetical protein [Actinomadura geliboluensis]|uniref:hypothetical protein n=1 Tax=Actinomadura geliboluensis TaxID=882440 RepID=UPI00371A85A5